MLPLDADHVTDLFVVVPCTVAAKVSFPLVVVDAEAGEIVTELTIGAGGAAAVTITLTAADFVASALLVAVIVAVPALAGAIYAPAEVMLPLDAAHVTDLFVVVPCTVAMKVSFPFVVVDAEAGEIVTVLTIGAATVTITLTAADFVASALLVAVIVAVPALAEAV
jgi:hypothetical protein